MAKFCTNCGSPIIDEARFCPNCGAEIPIATDQKDNAAVTHSKAVPSAPTIKESEHQAEDNKSHAVQATYPLPNTVSAPVNAPIKRKRSKKPLIFITSVILVLAITATVIFVFFDPFSKGRCGSMVIKSDGGTFVRFNDYYFPLKDNGETSCVLERSQLNNNRLVRSELGAPIGKYYYRFDYDQNAENLQEANSVIRTHFDDDGYMVSEVFISGKDMLNAGVNIASLTPNRIMYSQLYNQKLYFTTFQHDNNVSLHTLYRIDTENRKIEFIKELGTVEFLIHNDRLFYFRTMDKQTMFYRSDLDGKNEKLLTDLSDSRISGTIYPGQNGNVCLLLREKGNKQYKFIEIDASSGKTKELFQTEKRFKFSPVISDDGKKLYFATRKTKNDETDIYEVDLTNGKTTVLATNSEISEAISLDSYDGYLYIGLSLSSSLSDSPRIPDGKWLLAGYRIKLKNHKTDAFYICTSNVGSTAVGRWQAQ